MGTRIDVLVDGSRDLMRYVERIEYSEAIDRLDAVVFELRIGRNTDAEDLVTSVQAGKPFTVELIEDDAVVTEGAGDLIEVTHHRRQNGSYVMRVVGLDALHRLRGNQPAQVWEVGHADIVSEIASRHSLTAVADGVDTTAGFALQGDTGDAVFLRNLAREHNYYVRLLGTDLHFARREAAGTDVVCEWGTEIIDLTFRTSIDKMATKVIVHGYDFVTDELIEGEAAVADLKKISGGDTGPDVWQAAFGANEIILNQSGYSAATNATGRAKAELQQRAERFVTGRLLVPGKPAAVSGAKLTINGAGWPFSGDFLINETRHVLDPAVGYRTFVGFLSDSLPAAS